MVFSLRVILGHSVVLIGVDGPSAVDELVPWLKYGKFTAVGRGNQMCKWAVRKCKQGITINPIPIYGFEPYLASFAALASCSFDAHVLLALRVHG